MAVKPIRSELRSQLEMLKPAMMRVWGFSVLAGMLTLSPTIYMMQVYGSAITSRSVSTLALLTVVAIFVYAFMELLGWTAGGIMEAHSREFDRRINRRVFDALFSAKLVNAQGGGQQALGDLRTLREFIYSPAFLAVMEAPLSPIFLLIMFGISPALGYFSIFGAFIQVGLVYATEKTVQPPLREANIASAAAQGFAGSAQRNAEVVYAMGMMGGVHDRWMGLQRRFLYLQARASDYAGSLSTASKSIMLMQGSAGLGLSFWLMTKGEIAHGGIAIFGGIAGGRVLAPLVQVVAQWRLVVEARDAYSRMDKLLGAKQEEATSMELPPPEGNLSVEGITAGAPGGSTPIIHDVSFSLVSGQCLAIIGPSGSGKTTLARLLLGLWPALGGKVRLDGADMHAWSKSDLGRHLGYLPQDVELFEGTLAENIGRFADLDEDLMSEAISLAGLDDIISSLPDGIDAPIGVDGTFLSGGQRQRVGIARAVYGSPRLIVLDEPNSSLDERGERILLDMLFKLKSKGATIVVVTHRTSILPAVDKILVLGDGRVKLFGDRDQVVAALNPQAVPAATAGGQA